MSNATIYTEQGEFSANGGDVGGDNQVTDAANRRFVAKLPEGNFAVIDVYAFGTSEEMEEGAYAQRDVTEMTFYTVCTDPTDPGSTEVYSDVTYEFPFAMEPKDDEQASEWAQNYVKSLSASDYTWSGSDILH